MTDFLDISVDMSKPGNIVISPSFRTTRRSDLMTRGRDYYAACLDGQHWTTDEEVVIQYIDSKLREKYDEYVEKYPEYRIKVNYLDISSNRMIKRWHDYCKQDLRDKFVNLDQKLVFLDDTTTKKDYVSEKRLSYNPVPCDISNYEKLMNRIYKPEERHKIEWAIGSIVAGDSTKIQKFLVLYGDKGTGKSTVLNIIQKLFDGYYTVFDAKALGDKNNQFKLEPFKSHPLVAIQHDGDLSKIEDNTVLNSLISHEQMPVNEKNKSIYISKFNCMLFMGTNSPVKITDAKSGILRRLIDVSPSGDKLSVSEYRQVIKGIDFELGGIAAHCRDVYLEDKDFYDDYEPVAMMSATNPFFDYVEYCYFEFKEKDCVTLQRAMELYREYNEMAGITRTLKRPEFREELKNYFRNFDGRTTDENGNRVRKLYSGFRTEKFEDKKLNKIKTMLKEPEPGIIFKEQPSLLDELCANDPAQLANKYDKPTIGWDKVTTTLKDIDTSKVHYLKVPENHIVIDFDIPGDDGKKNFEANLKEASKWPKTYAELSKSGGGIHLHYIYEGDISKLSRVYADHIEVKIFNGGSSLRRKLTKCNDIPVATISSGLPLKEVKKKVISKTAVKNQAALESFIAKCMAPDPKDRFEPGSHVSMISLINTKLNEYYDSGIAYDVSHLKGDITKFAAQSTNHAIECTRVVAKMKLKSDIDIPPETDEVDEDKLAFLDIETFINLLVICYKMRGEGKDVMAMVNPSPEEVDLLLKTLHYIGYNCRRYDNHIMYARSQGATIEECYENSRRIIQDHDKTPMYGVAYDASYADIYEYASKKQSLKKWEIDLGIHHKECEYKWDEPVPEDKWNEIVDYCKNDVIATEAVFNATQGDWQAAKILAALSGLKVNSSTNSFTTRIIFDKDKKPQADFCYRDLSKPVTYLEPNVEEFIRETGLPIPFDDKSLLPYFPGYSYEFGKSSYKGVDEVGEGGYVCAKPGMYSNVVTYDVASMHPSSIDAECLFGSKYTRKFKDILDARIAIKHKDLAKAKALLGEKAEKYLNDPSTAKQLAQALKIAINSVYGLTSASFDNPFHDIRNKDNIVAKRGALFMIDLKEIVEKAGGEVVHIKTDSIKVVNPTKEIEQLIIETGKRYGYNFEIEHKFEKFCLVNNAVYIGKLALDDPDWSEEFEDAKKKGIDIPTRWTATGTQFAVPYVFKTLFSHEPIDLKDMCETKSVKTCMYIDNCEGLPEGEHNYKYVGKIGQFCPMLPGAGGGVLVREQGEKYNSVTGTKGYLWMETEDVITLKRDNMIDKSYYNKLVDDAVESISSFGDFEWFVSDDPVLTIDIQSDPLPESFN